MKGAEATLTFKEEKVVKKREKKNYRHIELDERIREQRTEKEARIMKQARKNNVNVPKLTKKNSYTLEIEKIPGDQLKDVLNDNINAMKELGENTAKLHNADIIHGDLTTRNVILAEKPVLIDFGLASRSERIEDKAIDLHLMRQVLETSHPSTAEEAWQKFLKGYSWENSDQVLERLEEVEKRGRYK